jgi:hypothetical protein
MLPTHHTARSVDATDVSTDLSSDPDEAEVCDLDSMAREVFATEER